MREIGGAAVERPGDGGGAAADERLRAALSVARMATSASRFDRLRAWFDSTTSRRTSGHCWQKRANKGVRRCVEKGVVGRHSQLAGRRQDLAGELAREAGHVVVHALGERRHLLAGGGQGIARAMTLEELGADRLLELPEAAEHRRVVDAEALGGARQAFRFGDQANELEIVPGKRLRIQHTCGPAKMVLRSYR